MDLSVIILAAGKGTRMHSKKTKGMHLLGGKPLISHSLIKAKELNAKEVIVVLDKTMQEMIEISQKTSTICYQEEKLGTANATLSAKNVSLIKKGVILVLYVDTPLISKEKLQELITMVASGKSSLAVLAFEKPQENAYGKLLVKDDNLVKIIENNDANEEEKKISLCNSGVMAVDASLIWNLLSKVNNDNSKKEYYLTDIVEIASSKGLKCNYILEEEENLQGVNSKLELAKLEKSFQQKKRKEFLEKGVQMINPESIFFSLDTQIGTDVIIHSDVHFLGSNIVEDNVEIKPFSVIEDSFIGKDSIVGPFARLRPNTILKENNRIGNFVEVKNSKIEKDSKINHLSYIGDSEVGEKTNIGAGVITCNYDGKNKYKTKIGNNNFIGSNVALVAPIELEENVVIAAGSTINKNVAKNSLAIARERQKNIKDWNK